MEYIDRCPPDEDPEIVRKLSIRDKKDQEEGQQESQRPATISDDDN